MREKWISRMAAVALTLLLTAAAVPAMAAGSGALFGEETLPVETEAPTQAEPVFENVLDDVLLESEEESESVEVVSDEEAVQIQIELAKEGSHETLKTKFHTLGITNIGSGNLNVRETPDAKGKVIGKMVGGDVCDVQDSTEDWYHIVSGPVDGYVAKEFIVAGEAAEDMAIDAMKTLKVTVDTDTLNVRTEPKAEAEILDRLDENEHYDVVESLGDWIQIELDDESVGYVSANYVSLG